MIDAAKDLKLLPMIKEQYKDKGYHREAIFFL